MGSVISIGVEGHMTKEELKSTLVLVADQRQDDSARDYLTSMYLTVDAYLIKDGKPAQEIAATLNRYVPPGNPEQRKRMNIDRKKWDKFMLGPGFRE